MRRIRLLLTGHPASGCLHDTLTDRDAAIWDADPLRLELWLANLEDPALPFDIDTITTLQIELRADEDTAALLIPAATPAAALTECTFANWQADLGFHARFAFTGANLNVSATTTSIWMSIRATLTDASTVTFGAGYIKIAHSRHGTAP